MKYPKKPKHPGQKYMLTEKGKELLKQKDDKGSGDLFHCLCHFYFCIKYFKFSNTDMCLYSLSCEMEYGSGFKVSLSMLKKMRIFYEEWQCLSIGSPMANQLQQLESIYYIHQVNLHHWNKYVLRKYLSDDLYHHQGNMPNNFPKAIPDFKQSMKTISMFKDEYLLDFINTENLGLEIEDIDERVVEQEIVRNMRDFILQFGKDFIFMGNQYRVVLEGEEMFIDLLFFSRELAAMVAVELKYGKFKPSYLGQLCTYLQALDLTVKKPHENPSIGIVLCKEMNKAFVDIVVRNYDSPMGVATYKTKQDMPEELQKALPDLDKMKDLFCKSL